MKNEILSQLREVAGCGSTEFDSLVLMKLILFAEKEFDLSFSRKDFSAGRLSSIDALAELILKKLESRD